MSYGVLCFRNKLKLAWALGDLNRKFDMHLKVNRGNTHQRRYHPGRNYHWHKPYRNDPFHSCDTFHSFQLLHRKLKIQIIQLCNLLNALAYIIIVWKAIQITWTSYWEESLMRIYLYTHVCVCLCVCVKTVAYTTTYSTANNIFAFLAGNGSAGLSAERLLPARAGHLWYGQLSPALGWWTLPCLACLWARIWARPAKQSAGWRNTVTNI